MPRDANHMRVGYIASHLYRHTFEINEATELLRRRPDTRLYSFYRPRGCIQTGRLEEIRDAIVPWSAGGICRAFVALARKRPAALAAAALELAVRSLPNPVYWFKNAAAFLVALPILSDAMRAGATHLHANFGSSPATVAWLGRRILGTKMSVTYHAFDIYYGKLTHRDPLKRRKLRDADLVLAVHRDGLEHLMRLVPEQPRDKFDVIRISVAFTPAPRGSATPPLLVAAGNLVPKKGFDVLVRAVGILAREGVDVRARILGEGPERERLEALARHEGVDDRIEMPGFYAHADFARHLAEATALVMPSRICAGGQRDGIPTVVVEAWLSETPVVASLVGGMPEVIVDGRTGLVFPPGDAGALADCVRRLLSSPELRGNLAQRGLGVARAEFSPQRNVARLLDRIASVR